MALGSGHPDDWQHTEPATVATMLHLLRERERARR